MKKRVLLLLCLLICLCMSASAAGMVTDTLTVKAGYWGMDVSSYVELGTYHWSELESNLPLHWQAYSFFRPDAEGEYRIAIDSAYGFYLTDLLSYANIWQDDVLSLQFYTQDQTVGYFTSFTWQDLFGTQRYYFDDLAAHIHPVYDEDGNVTSWDASEAWGSCIRVPAMLALEDSWVWYDIGTEHTAPNYQTMSTGNRFRLLFGQSSPLETRTNQTAKYTHTVYVTLKGSPVLGELPELDATIGSHSVEVTVTVDNAALLEAIASLLKISSSNEAVLRITDVRITPDGQYSDLAHVEICYDVLTEGEASLSFAFGTQTIGSSQPLVVSGDADDNPPGEDASGNADTPGDTQTSDDDGQSTPAEPSASPESSDQTSGQSGPEAPPTEAPTQASSEAPTQPPEESAPEGSGEPIRMAAPQDGTETPADVPQTAAGSGRQAIVLDAATVSALLQQPEPEQAVAEPVIQLSIPAQENSAALLWTVLAAGLLILLGGLSALICFKKER